MHLLQNIRPGSEKFARENTYLLQAQETKISFLIADKINFIYRLNKYGLLIPHTFEFAVLKMTYNCHKEARYLVKLLNITKFVTESRYTIQPINTVTY